jgi:hypothetical protein
LPPNPDAGLRGATCDDLSVLVVANPSLAVDGGACALSPGREATLAVDLEEVAGKGFDAYPGVHFTADVPGVTVTDAFDVFAIAACQTQRSSTRVTVNAGVPRGTVAHVVAQVAMLNRSCPNAYAITVPLLVE